jgi:hypothetical protein
MNRLLLLALLPAALLGCATAPTPAPAANAPVVASQDLSCEREVKTGTMMPTTRCRTAEQREADRKSAETAADFVRGGNQKMAPGK